MPRGKGWQMLFVKTLFARQAPPLPLDSHRPLCQALLIMSFSGVLFWSGFLFPLLLFHFFLRSDPQFFFPPEIGQGFRLHFCDLWALRNPFPI